MKKEIYEPLAKKVRELVPELMKLSFGCEVRDNSAIPRIHGVVTYYNKHSKDLRLSDEDGFQIGCDDNVQIIGHPITLEHILTSCDGRRFEVYSYMSMTQLTDVLSQEKIYWKTGEPLSEQSDELGEFLTEVLL